MEEMLKAKCCKQYGQVYGHHDKMARTKHTEHHKTRVYKDATDIRK